MTQPRLWLARLAPVGQVADYSLLSLSGLTLKSIGGIADLGA